MSTSNFVDPNNCALDAQGNLKDASDIQFYDSEGDDAPISTTTGKAIAGPSSKIAFVMTFLVVLTLNSGQLLRRLRRLKLLPLRSLVVVDGSNHQRRQNERWELTHLMRSHLIMIPIIRLTQAQSAKWAKQGQFRWQEEIKGSTKEESSSQKSPC